MLECLRLWKPGSQQASQPPPGKAQIVLIQTSTIQTFKHFNLEPLKPYKHSNMSSIRAFKQFERSRLQMLE